jgi:S1-C subfamily serine protease
MGLAARAELQPGDIIVSINSVDVSTIEDFKSAMKKASVSKGIRFVVESQGMQRFAIIREIDESDD